MAVVARPYHAHLRLGQRRAVRGMGALVVLAMLAATLALITLGQTGRVATRGYRLSQLERQRILTIRQNDQLRLQIAQMRSLDRVQQRAAEALSMRLAEQDQLRYLTVEVQQLPVIARSR